MRVQIEDAREAEARIVGREPDAEVAMLKVDLPPRAVGVAGPARAIYGADVVLAIDGTTPANAQDALVRIARCKPGSNIVLRGLRGGRVFEVRAQVGERPRSG